MPYAVFTTLHEPDAARHLAHAAVEAGLAACVHIQEITSVIRWDGAVQEEPEYRLLFKTSHASYDALAALIVRDHPYDEPALWAAEMVKGSDSFFGWIDASTASEA